ncbi:MAG: phosphofructokinase [Promethearchaeota archaeon CR_4]|nr:MAG: phosphofructokinase [Candidatus Lokiarchaeota archaeon CR_4]
MRVGVLTGGGDAPGLNAVIYGVLLKAFDLGHEVIGILKGWKGFLNNETVPLDITRLDDLHTTGGTILYTSRTNPFEKVGAVKDPKGKEEAIRKHVRENLVPKFDLLGIDALIAIGGDDTLSVAARLAENCDKKIVGVPKTIDNDLSGTDYTFGFWSSVQLAATTLENLQTTAKSHQRIMVIEVMGRNAGWLTLMSGIASGADIILMPETRFDLQEDVINVLIKRVQNGYIHHMIAVSEGAIPTDESLKRDFKTITKETFEKLPKDVFGNPKLAGLNFSKILADELNKNTKLKEEFKQNNVDLEVRDFVLGHSMRAGAPIAFDRILGLRFGVRAMELVHEGKTGIVVSLRGTNIETCTLTEAAKQRTVDQKVVPDLYELKRLVTATKHVAKEKLNK